METQQRRTKEPWVKRAAPWLAVFVFLLLPMYVISATILIKSGLFNLRGNELNDAQYKALWAFIASGLGTAATIFGLLFARSHNQRTLAFQIDIENRKLMAEQEANNRNATLQEDAAARLSLDTVVKGLELIVSIDGKYAPKAKIAGALAALVHLHHPIIAMRTLSSAWDDDKVDAGTAAWLISEVYREGKDGGSGASMVEASELLRRNAAKLCSSTSEGQFEWPDIIVEDWPPHIPVDARFNNLDSAVEVLLSRDRGWWIRGGGYGWIILLLDEIRRNDPEDSVRTTAASILKLLAESYPKKDAGWPWKGEFKYLADIREAVASHELGHYTLAGTQETLRRIKDWASVNEKPSSWKRLKAYRPRRRTPSEVRA